MALFAQIAPSERFARWAASKPGIKGEVPSGWFAESLQQIAFN